MAGTHFKWIGADTVTRSKGGGPGIELHTDHHYDIAAFGADVVDEWVRTGHAKIIEHVGNDTTLTVQNAVIKSKSPKIG